MRVRLLLLGPGHTPGDTVIFVEGDGVLFSGDLAMKQAFPAFTSAQSRTDTWLTALDPMDGLRPTKIVGAHYGTGDASIIAAYRDYMTTLRQRVGQLKSQGKSADETAKIMRAECQAKFPDWDQVARVELAATVTYAQLP